MSTTTVLTTDLSGIDDRGIYKNAGGWPPTTPNPATMQYIIDTLKNSTVWEVGVHRWDRGAVPAGAVINAVTLGILVTAGADPDTSNAYFEYLTLATPGAVSSADWHYWGLGVAPSNLAATVALSTIAAAGSYTISLDPAGFPAAGEIALRTSLSIASHTSNLSYWETYSPAFGSQYAATLTVNWDAAPTFAPRWQSAIIAAAN